MQPVMEAILANWYWHYFQQNRWRFMQRTATAAPPGDDFTDLGPAADLRRDRQAVHQGPGRGRDAEEDAHRRVRRPAATRATRPTPTGPTLFDFLAFNALEFYTAGEQAGAKAEDAFDLSADSPIFAPAEEFVAWQVQTTDTDSPTLKAIRLYQDLLKFHAADDDRAARIDADLWRLSFGNNKAFGEEKNARYKAALKRLADKWADHELSARALHDWATVLHEEGDFVAARQIAQQGLARFPDSVGGRRCYNLIQQIEAKSVAVSDRAGLERAAADDRRPLPQRHQGLLPRRAVRLRRLGQVAAPPAERPERRPNGRQLLAKKPVLEWSADLPATEDFQERRRTSCRLRRT